MKINNFINFWITFQIIGGIVSALIMYYIVTVILHIDLSQITSIIK